LRIGPNLVAPRRQRERIYTASSAAPRGRGHEKVALSGDLSAAASRLRDVPALAGLGVKLEGALDLIVAKTIAARNGDVADCR
jgi:hypothetical protein